MQQDEYRHSSVEQALQEAFGMWVPGTQKERIRHDSIATYHYEEEKISKPCNIYYKLTTI